MELNLHGRSLSSRVGRTRLAMFLVVAAASTAVALVPMSEPSGAAGRTPPPPSWQKITQFPIAAASFDQATCTSATSCVAVGQYAAENGSLPKIVFARSTNGGVSWTETAVAAPFLDLSFNAPPTLLTVHHQFTCAAKTCLVLGSTGDFNFTPEVLASTDGGAHWTVRIPSAPLGVTAFLDVACPSSSSCYALASTATGSEILKTANAASSWTSQDTTSASLSSISCSSASDCSAVATATGASGFFTTTTGGTSWTPSSTPSTVQGEADVECPATNICYLAGGSGVSESTDGGTTWHVRTLPASVSLVHSLSCRSATSCALVGTSSLGSLIMAATPNSGLTWTTPPVPSPTDGHVRAPVSEAVPSSITCAGPATCVVTGSAQPVFADYYSFGFLMRSGNAGDTWSSVRLASGADAVSTVACASSWCEAVTSGPELLMGSSNLGTSWGVQAESNPIRGGVFRDVACATKLDCVAVGAVLNTLGGVIGDASSARTTNGGRSWRFAPVTAAYSLAGVTCPSAKVCMAVGVKSKAVGPILLRSVNGGSTWASLHLPSATTTLNDIACSSIVRCVAVGEAGGGPAILTTLNGTSWSRRSIAASSMAKVISYLTAITCPTPAVCIAGGASKGASGTVVVTSDAGAHWRALRPPTKAGLVSDIACVTASRCELVSTGLSGFGALSFGSTNGGSSWSKQGLPGGVETLSALSCPTSKACVAVGVATPGVGVVVRRLG